MPEFSLNAPSVRCAWAVSETLIYTTRLTCGKDGGWKSQGGQISKHAETPVCFERVLLDTISDTHLLHVHNQLWDNDGAHGSKDRRCRRFWWWSCYRANCPPAGELTTRLFLQSWQPVPANCTSFVVSPLFSTLQVRTITITAMVACYQRTATLSGCHQISCEQ